LKNIQTFAGFRRDGTKNYDGKYKKEQVVTYGDLTMGVTDMTQDSRTVASVALVPNLTGVSVISASLIKIVSDIDNVFLYAMFKYGNVSRYISQFANGANVLHLRPQAVLNIKVMLSPQEMIDKYVRIAKPFLEQIEMLNPANTNLAKKRDMLLPRLISNQLVV
jgi:type I restriction enzyme S subunit